MHLFCGNMCACCVFLYALAFNCCVYVFVFLFMCMCMLFYVCLCVFVHTFVSMCCHVYVCIMVYVSLGPRPKPTPARIASSITRGVLDAIRAGVGLGLGPRLGVCMCYECMHSLVPRPSAPPAIKNWRCRRPGNEAMHACVRGGKDR